MAVKEIEEGKKASAKRTKKAVLAPFPEEAAITLVLAQALGTPHDEESYQPMIRHREFNPWSHELQNIRATPQKQHCI